MWRGFRYVARWALTLLAVLCLAMWIRSYWRFESIAASRPWKGFGVASYDGVISVNVRMTDEAMREMPSEWMSVVAYHGITLSSWPRLGFDSDPLPIREWKFGIWPDSRAFVFEKVVEKEDAIVPIEFASQGARPTVGDTFYRVHLTYWSLFAALSLVPVAAMAIHVRRWMKTRRLASGVCCHCGYDLRATPERCPECGNEVKKL